jgi:hypothetical protein
MMKSKVYIFINIVGMAIAIACCIVAYYNYDFNASFDTNHKNLSEIYRVNSVRTFQGRETEYGVVPIPLGEVARQNVKDAEAVTRYSSSYADFRVKDEIFDAGLSYVDPDFFGIFTFEFVEGNPGALNDKTKVVISDRLAERLFGTESALGKGITHVLPENKLREFEVGGVIKLSPTNSSFNDDAYTVYENYWEVSAELENGTNWIFRNTLFLHVKNPDRIASIEQQLKPFAESNNKVREDFVLAGFKLDPLTGMAVRDEYSDRGGGWTRSASPMAMLGLSAPEPMDLDAVAAPEADPEARALLAQAYALLQTLPTDERIAWTLRHVERHRLGAVATLTGCSLATAKRRILRAERYLDEHFVAPFGEDA